jgi:hypothetical protein
MQIWHLAYRRALMHVRTAMMDQDLDDPSQVGSLLDQFDDAIVEMTADGAYDGASTYQTIAQHGDGIEVVTLPRATAVAGGKRGYTNTAGSPSGDDRGTRAGRVGRSRPVRVNGPWQKRQWVAARR